MTEYRLENGDKIEVGKLYKTRDGRKAFVYKFSVRGPAMGVIEGYDSTVWQYNGQRYFDSKEDIDLISLWPSESVTNCDQLGKIEVTDEILDLSCEIYKEKGWGCGGNIRISMKAALEAVFAYIANNKPDNTIEQKCKDAFNFMAGTDIYIKDVISERQDNDGWIELGKYNSVDLPVSDNVLFEIKLFDGSVKKLKHPYRSWVAKSLSDYIIAYRIISEPKKEKKECECKTASVVSVNNMQERICIKCGEKVTQKEPKKETLLQWARKRFPEYMENPPALLILISEYLENN